MMYLGFGTDLFCQFPANQKSYHSGPPSSTSRVGYNFELNETVYYPSLRSWYEAATEAAGFTTFVSTYIFAGNGIGATIGQAILDEDNSLRNVLAYDIIPYSGVGARTDLISKLLFDSSNQSFSYFMIDVSEVEPGNYNKDSIVSDLTRMIYRVENDTDETLAEKEREISESYKVEEFTDLNDQLVEYISYTSEGDKKYLFFSDVTLFEYRRDGSYQVRVVNKLGFTESSDVLEGDLRETIEDSILHEIGLNIAGGLIIMLIGICVGILASRYFANTLVDPFINL